jgi:hypothetical protein
VVRGEQSTQEMLTNREHRLNRLRGGDAHAGNRSGIATAHPDIMLTEQLGHQGRSPSPVNSAFPLRLVIVHASHPYNRRDRGQAEPYLDQRREFFHGLPFQTIYRSISEKCIIE